MEHGAHTVVAAATAAAGSSTSEDLIDLPPGFRFHPTDEEIITHYLTEKVMNPSFSACAVAEVDLNKSEPWDLPKKAKMGEKEYYFFCQRDRKYPTGMRTNRATEAGYWKATGKDKEIYKGKNCLVGMKKTLVFYKGRAPKGEKTNWVMHEYRLEGKFSYYNLPKSAKDEWVVCRVFHKNTGLKKSPSIPGLFRINSLGEDFLLDYSSSLPPLMDPPSNYSIDANPQEHEFKSKPNSQGNYYASFQTNINTDQNQNQNIFFYPQNNYNFQTQIPVHHQNPILSSYPTTPNINCKVEPFSSTQSIVSRSQDTGLSTDMNATAEISSSINVSKPTFDDLEDSIPGLANIWDY